MTRVLIPQGADYRKIVRDLIKGLEPLGLSSYSLGYEQDDAQLIVSGSGSQAGEEVLLTEEQREQIALILPSGVRLS